MLNHSFYTISKSDKQVILAMFRDKLELAVTFFPVCRKSESTRFFQVSRFDRS